VKNIIKKILRENNEDKITELVINRLKTSGPPYFKMLENYGVDENNQIMKIMRHFFPSLYIVDTDSKRIVDKRHNILYDEFDDESWNINEFDQDNNIIKVIEDGYWKEFGYNDNGDLISVNDSNGSWVNRKYDNNHNVIYYEDSSGFWFKKEYDEDGEEIYKETSELGIVKDLRNN
jgi:hypothetical protein